MLDGVKACFGVSLVCALAISAWAQGSGGRIPRFEDYPAKDVFKGIAANPQLIKPEERRFRTVIRQGVSKGWGVTDGITGKEMPGPGANFAGHYIIVTWGCGSPCLMAAIVDLKTGRVYPPPFHHGPGHSYFQVPWAFPMNPPLSYKLDSRLLVANICEELQSEHSDGQTVYTSKRCGAHYFVMTDNGPKLVHKVLER